MENQFRLDEDQGKDEPATQPAGKHPTSNIERPMMNEKDKGELETRVCSQPNCEHGGKPQPIDEFKIHPRFGTRFKMCNSCFTKRFQAGQQRRHERLKEEKKKGSPLKKIKDERLTPARLASESVAGRSNGQHPTSNEKPVTASSKADASGPLPPVPLDPKTYQYWPPDLLGTLLDGLPEILKTIEETAHEQERTPIAQVRYFLKTDYRITGTDAE